MNDTLSFWVPGDPAVQGSKRAFVLPGTRRAVLVDASKKTKPWRALVSLSAQQALAGRPWQLDGAFRVELSFNFQRPKSHYGKNGIKADAPEFHTTRLDLDKLCRAVFDAGSGILWRDDRLIYVLHAERAYGETPGVRIEVERVE